MKILLNVFFIIAILSFSQIAFGAIVNCGTTQNPCNFTAFIAMINNTFDWIKTMAISIGAISFAYAGYLILFHPDNAGEREKALNIFKKTIIGLFIFLCSWLIVYLIVKTLTGESSVFLKYLQG